MSDPSFVAPAPSDPSLVIREIPPSITTYSVPFSRGGLPVGGRSTAVKLADGSVFLLASHALCPETLASIQAIGKVAHIVVADHEHTMFTPQYAKAFPDAKVYTPQTAADKFKKQGAGFHVHHVYGSEVTCPLDAATNGEIRSVDFSKSHVNEEIAFHHVPSKTLIEADLLFNLPCHEQYSKSSSRSSIPLLTSNFGAGSGMQQFIVRRVLCKDFNRMKTAVALVSAMDFDRIIPCHGDVIETGGKQAWNKTFSAFL